MTRVLFSLFRILVFLLFFFLIFSTVFFPGIFLPIQQYLQQLSQSVMLHRIKHVKIRTKLYECIRLLSVQRRSCLV